MAWTPQEPPERWWSPFLGCATCAPCSEGKGWGWAAPGCLGGGRAPVLQLLGGKKLLLLQFCPLGSHPRAGVGLQCLSFPVLVCRLLVRQLREEKQQHEEEVQGLHLDICSLKQLSQLQAALIQELQGQEGLQYHCSSRRRTG